MAGSGGIRIGGFERSFRDDEARAQILTKANSADVYTKAEADIRLNKKADIATTYTKTEVDTKVGAKANAVDVYTKTEADGLLGDKADKAGTYTLGVGTYIPEGADLNDYKAPGVYWGTTAANSPMNNENFVLVVDTGRESLYPRQTYMDFASGRKYTRIFSFDNGTWNPWFVESNVFETWEFWSRTLGRETETVGRIRTRFIGTYPGNGYNVYEVECAGSCTLNGTSDYHVWLNNWVLFQSITNHLGKAWGYYDIYTLGNGMFSYCSIIADAGIGDSYQGYQPCVTMDGNKEIQLARTYTADGSIGGWQQWAIQPGRFKFSILVAAK